MLRWIRVAVLCLILAATAANTSPNLAAAEVTFGRTGTTIYVPSFVNDSESTETSSAGAVYESNKINNNEIAVKSSSDNTYVRRYNSNYAAYTRQELPIVESFRSGYNGSLVHAIVGRAIWYMEYGFMIYGHQKYWDSGLIDCSNFVSLVYKDFGYSVTSAARKYNTVGSKVSGVYSQKISGTSNKYKLVGVNKLRPGDVMTFWKKDSSGNRYIGHVALYMGKIDGKPTIIHTCKDNPTAIGITNSFTYWYGEHFAGARRVLSTATGNKTVYKDLGPVIPEVYKLPPQTPVIMPKNLPNGF